MSTAVRNLIDFTIEGDLDNVRITVENNPDMLSSDMTLIQSKAVRFALQLGFLDIFMYFESVPLIRNAMSAQTVLEQGVFGNHIETVNYVLENYFNGNPAMLENIGFRIISNNNSTSGMKLETLRAVLPFLKELNLLIQTALLKKDDHSLAKLIIEEKGWDGLENNSFVQGMTILDLIYWRRVANPLTYAVFPSRNNELLVAIAGNVKAKFDELIPSYDPTIPFDGFPGNAINAAVQYDRPEMLRILLALGVPIEYGSDISPFVFDQHPIHQACISGSLECLEILLDASPTFDLESAYTFYYDTKITCVDAAIREGNKDIVNYLLGKGVNLHTGRTGIYLIIENRRQMENMKPLLKLVLKNGFDVEHYLTVGDRRWKWRDFAMFIFGRPKWDIFYRSVVEEIEDERDIAALVSAGFDEEKVSEWLYEMKEDPVDPIEEWVKYSLPEDSAWSNMEGFLRAVQFREEIVVEILVQYENIKEDYYNMVPVRFVTEVAREIYAADIDPSHPILPIPAIKGPIVIDPEVPLEEYKPPVDLELLKTSKGITMKKPFKNGKYERGTEMQISWRFNHNISFKNVKLILVGPKHHEVVREKFHYRKYGLKFLLHENIPLGSDYYVVMETENYLGDQLFMTGPFDIV